MAASVTLRWRVFSPATRRRAPRAAPAGATIGPHQHVRRALVARAAPEGGAADPRHAARRDGRGRSSLLYMLIMFINLSMGSLDVEAMADVIVAPPPPPPAPGADEIPGCMTTPIELLFNVLDLIFFTVFLVEILFRLFGFGVNYLRDWINAIDAVVVVVSFVLALVPCIDGPWGLLRVVRFLRFCRRHQQAAALARGGGDGAEARDVPEARRAGRARPRLPLRLPHAHAVEEGPGEFIVDDGGARRIRRPPARAPPPPTRARRRPRPTATAARLRRRRPPPHPPGDRGRRTVQHPGARRRVSPPDRRRRERGRRGHRHFALALVRDGAQAEE